VNREHVPPLPQRRTASGVARQAQSVIISDVSEGHSPSKPSCAAGKAVIQPLSFLPR